MHNKLMVLSQQTLPTSKPIYYSSGYIDPSPRAQLRSLSYGASLEETSPKRCDCGRKTNSNAYSKSYLITHTQA